MRVSFRDLLNEESDNPLGMSTGAADIFGLTGGVMEAENRNQPTVKILPVAVKVRFLLVSL
ncbi:MAG: hypothetical protein CVU97_04220 [Firmicutes bacterium HGW-Firmicutes-21]|nr:MAG: hypothetical protein CVU97_04220 [Firmicutes bacterium HGW-Firmicutes-21]